jgi:hypothetical protein
MNFRALCKLEFFFKTPLLTQKLEFSKEVVFWELIGKRRRKKAGLSRATLEITSRNFL